MVSALVVGDRRVGVSDGRFFTTGPVSVEGGLRYLRWFDCVTLVGRESHQIGVLEDATELSGVNVKVLPDPIKPRVGLGERLAARKELRRLVLEHDAVIARMPSFLGLCATRIADEYNKPLAIDLASHAGDGLRAHGSITAKVYAPVFHRRCQVAVARAHYVSFVTHKYLQKHYPIADTAVSISCSNVEIPDVSDEVLKRRLARINSFKTSMVIGTVGSLAGKLKGVSDAIDALAQAKPRLAPFVYAVVGGGNSQGLKSHSQRRELGSNVTFLGSVRPGKDLYSFLDSCDLYLHPSRREGLPRAVIEAMSRGLPVIASSAGGTPELLPADVLHQPKDVARLATLIVASQSAEFQRHYATLNFRKAKHYSSSLLAPRRDAFWQAFASFSQARKDGQSSGA